MWNGNQSQQQYPSQIPTRLDFPTPLPSQRLPPSQPSPSSQYSHPISNTNLNKTNYSSNSTVTTNNRKERLVFFSFLSSFSFISVPNDGWMNSLYIDPAIISFGNKLEPSNSQWSTTTQSQGSSTLSSGNNLISPARWSQSPSQPMVPPPHPQVSSQYPNHLMTNGIYPPYSTTSPLDDGNRS